MDDDAKTMLEKLLLLWCAPKSDELLGAWNLHRDFGESIVCFNERACRKDWDGLDLPSSKKVFNSVRRAGAAPNSISNVVRGSLYEDFLKIQEANTQTLTQRFDEQVQHRNLDAPAAPAAQNEASPPWMVWTIPTSMRGPSRRRCIRLGPRLLGRERITHGGMPWA